MSFERRKVRVGRVVSDKMDKTVVVSVEWRQPHRVYKKSVKRRARLKVHDEQNQCRIGDLVRVMETRPLSRSKRWRVTEILDRQEVVEVRPEDVVVGQAEAEEEPVSQEAAEAAVQEVAEAIPEESDEEAMEEALGITEEQVPESDEGQDEEETRER